MKKNRKADRGFTLIELVIVVAILAILVGVLAPSYTKYVKKSKVTKCEAQRAEIEKAYQIACIEDSILAGITQTIDFKFYNIGDPIKYIAELGFYNVDEAVCPVSNENYTLAVSTNSKGQKSVEVQCSCVNNLLDYIGTANKIYDDKYKGTSYGRQELIKDFFEQRGSLIEVDNNMKADTRFSTDTLYWRPYTLKDGKVVLYASHGNDSTHAGWNASLIYVDGKIYQSTGTNVNGNPNGSSIASIYNYTGDELEKWLKEDTNGQKFELVTK